MQVARVVSGARNASGGRSCVKFLKLLAIPVAWLLGALAAPGLALAGFADGGFESNAYAPNWTLGSYTNSGIQTFPPTTKSHLNLAPVANNGITLIVGAGTDGPLTTPLVGSRTAVVNYLGNGARASSILQTATMALADVDPTDGKVHLRFAIAPVVSDGGHGPTDQAYFFVEVRNVTKGTQLFQTFNFANQPGVPWQTVGSYQYTGWQALDISPGNGFLDVGDQVQLEIIASGCSASGHAGYVYVDGVGAFFPGLLVSAAGPTTAVPGGQVTYTYTYSNTSGVAVTNTTVNAVSPQESLGNFATFVSYNAPGGTCTAPAVGATGTVSCNFGTLNNNSNGTFQITYTVPAGAGTASPNNQLNNGNYAISATGASAFLGPLVQTTVVPAAGSNLADLVVTLADGVSSVAPSGALTYTITVSNNGPTAVTGATLAQTASSLTLGNWTCTPTGGASCTANGTGSLGGQSVSIPVGESVTFVQSATAAVSGTTATTITATVPGGITESNTTNNSIGDTNTIGLLYTLTLDKAGAGSGAVASVPAGISCGTACATASMQVTDGGQAILTASAPAGSIFSGWTGACTGSSNPCTVTIAGADATVTATFVASVTVSVTVGANGTSSPSAPQVIPSGGSFAFTLTPSGGYFPLVTGTCAGTLTGSGPYTYTLDPVNADCSVSIAFSNGYQVTASAGANGSIAPSGVTMATPGAQPTFTVTPSAGYVAQMGGTCGGTLVGTTYTTSAVNAPCTVVASFKANTALALASSANPQTYGGAVTYTATLTGSISPTGTITFQSGGVDIPGCVGLSAATGTATCTPATLGAGTYAVTVAFAGDAGNMAANAGPLSQVVNAAPQSISLPLPAMYSLGNLTMPIVPVATSGLAVAVTSLTPSVCTVSGSTVNLVMIGLCTLHAVQAGNANWQAAPNLDQTFFVTQATPTAAVTRSAGANPSHFASPVTFTGTLTGAVNPTGTMTFQDMGFNIPGCVNLAVTGPATACTLSTLAMGPHSIVAIYNGDLNNVGAFSPAIPHTIIKGNQAITFAAAPTPTFTVGGTFSVSAGLNSGLAPAYASATPAVCTVDAATGLVTVVTAGTCTVNANQAGDGNWNAAPQVAQSVTIAKAAQTVSFGAAPTPTFSVNGTFSVSATATSGLAVAYASQTAAVCTVNPSTGVVAIVAGGLCRIAASQPGDVNYNAAVTVTQDVTIAQAAQTIAFAPPANRTLSTVNFTLPVTASSGLPVGLASQTPSVCSASGTAVTLIAQGTCTLRASQPGDASYLAAADVDRGFTVGQAVPALAVTRTAGTSPSAYLAGVTFTATLTNGFNPTGSVTFQDGGFDVAGCVAVPLSGNSASCAVTTLAVGAHAITAIYTGNPNNLGAISPSLAHTVSQASQSISFGALSSRVAGSAPFTVAATGGASGNPVAFASLTPAVCSVSGNTVTILAAGTCTLRASQPGSTNYVAAPDVDQSFTVTPAVTTLALARTSGTSPAAAASPLAFKATLSGAFNPTGTVTFRDGGSDIAGCTAVPLASAEATCNTSFALAGAHAVSATYSGDANNAAAVSAPVAQEIGVTAPASIQVTGGADQVTRVSTTFASPVTVRVLDASGNAVPNATVTWWVPGVGASGRPASPSTVTDGSGQAGVMLTANGISGAFSVMARVDAVQVLVPLSNMIPPSPGSQCLANGTASDLIEQYYQGILGRPSDPAGKAWWIAEAERMCLLGVDQKQTFQVMASLFYASPEYTSQEPSDADFITDNYVTQLGRQPDPDGLAYWTAMIAAGVPREVVMHNFLFSTEFTNYTRALFTGSVNRAEVYTVVDIYGGLMNRLPDNGGFAYWVGRMREAQCQGGTAVAQAVEDMSRLFAGSPEYAGRLRSDAGYVADLYYSLLQRGAELTGFDYWMNQLGANRVPRDTIRRQFIGMPEMQEAIADINAQGCLR